MSGLAARWLSSLHEVDADRWNRAAEGLGFYSSHEWLLTQETHPAATARYLVVEDRDAIRAAVPLYEVRHEGNARYSVEQLGLETSTVAGEPTTVLGNRRGYHAGPLVAPDGAGAPGDVIANVRDALSTALGDRNGGGPAYWLYVPDRVLPQVTALGGTPVRVLATDHCLRLSRGGWEAYVADLPAQRRRKVRRERATFLRSGAVVGLEHPAPLAGDLGRLAAELEAKYGHRRDAAELARYYERLGASRRPGEVLTCRRDGHLVGFVHFYDFGGRLWARTAGFDYARLAGAYEYFNLAFYELVELAGRRGRHAVHVGPGSAEAKTNHGATTEALWAVRQVARAARDGAA